MRNEADNGPTSEGAVITYSRVPPRGARPSVDRQEPFLDAREVPFVDDDLRAYDPERASGLDDSIVEDLAEPGPTRRHGARGAVLIGAVALAAGMVIVAYAYGVVTRVDAPSLSSASAPAADAAAPQSADVTSATPAAEDAAGSASVTSAVPATRAVDAGGASSDVRPAVTTEPPTPKPAPKQATIAPAGASEGGADGLPMDGDSGAQPALVAPVPANATPKAPITTPSKSVRAGSSLEKAAPADAQDQLITNIERLLAHDAADAGTTGQPVGAPPQAAAPTAIVPQQPPLASEQQVDDPNALPPLPAPGVMADAPPPSDALPPSRNRLIPPADIPNVPSADGMSMQ